MPWRRGMSTRDEMRAAVTSRSYSWASGGDYRVEYNSCFCDLMEHMEHSKATCLHVHTRRRTCLEHAAQWTQRRRELGANICPTHDQLIALGSSLGMTFVHVLDEAAVIGSALSFPLPFLDIVRRSTWGHSGCNCHILSRGFCFLCHHISLHDTHFPRHRIIISTQASTKHGYT